MIDAIVEEERDISVLMCSGMAILFYYYSLFVLRFRENSRCREGIYGGVRTVAT